MYIKCNSVSNAAIFNGKFSDIMNTPKNLCLLPAELLSKDIMIKYVKGA